MHILWIMYRILHHLFFLPRVQLLLNVLDIPYYLFSLINLLYQLQRFLPAPIWFSTGFSEHSYILRLINTRPEYHRLIYSIPLSWTTHSVYVHWVSSPVWAKGLSSVCGGVPLVPSADGHFWSQGMSSTGWQRKMKRWGKKRYKSELEFTEWEKINVVFNTLCIPEVIHLYFFLFIFTITPVCLYEQYADSVQ